MNKIDIPGAVALRRLAFIGMLLGLVVVVLGAWVRLTDAGLGCPDWPGCYGQASPVGARADIQAAQTALPSGPVTHGKAWVEMIHRYLASAVGVLCISLCVLSWRQRRQGADVGPAAAAWCCLGRCWW